MIFNIFKIIKKRKKRRRLHFILDISLSVIILLFIVFIFTFNLYQPSISDSEIKSPQEPDEPVEINDPLEIEFSLSSLAIEKNSFKTLNLNYKNTSEDEIDEIVVSLETITSGFNLSRLESDSLPENVEINGRDLVIENIDGFSDEEIVLRAYFSNPADPLLRHCAWRALIDINFLDEEFSQEYSLDNVRFLSDTNVTSSAYYHSIRGDQLGIGPIPPIVSIPTSYWVFFQIDNLGNDLSDFVFSGQLPHYASLGEKKSLLAGNYSYNPDNNQLIWQVPSIDKSGGTYRAGFEIEIIPDKQHTGQVLNIIENLRYRYKDSVCYQEKSGSLPNLDTNLQSDFINQGQGTVIE